MAVAVPPRDAHVPVQVLESDTFAAALVAVLALGNYLNAGTTNGDAVAYKFEALVKLADTKSIDGNESLLSFLARSLLAAGHAPLALQVPALFLGNMDISMEVRPALLSPGRGPFDCWRARCFPSCLSSASGYKASLQLQSP